MFLWSGFSGGELRKMFLQCASLSCRDKYEEGVYRSHSPVMGVSFLQRHATMPLT
jgi:hypothetical protein